MAISKKVQDAFNDQINAETFSAYLYWSMAAYFESVDLPGFALWMQVQASEETAHAMKFYHTIVERGGRVHLAAIEAPDTEWQSPLAAFEAAYKHECYITGRIADLMDLAVVAKDHAAASFLKWFVDEQVEEEASVDRVVKMLKMAAQAPGAMLMLDHQMGQRAGGKS